MSGARQGELLRQIETLYGGGCVAGVGDWVLLARWADRRDEAAFAALVQRHGPLVLGVCRRRLRDPRDVEDAFQATFLVLARKGGALRPRGGLGTWLYEVARRVSATAKVRSARAGFREATVGTLPEVVAPEEHPDRFELREIVDEELGRLPARDRAAVVLCDLQGFSHSEAAAALGWPVGTVKGRLSRARDRLRERLGRRGVSLSAAGLVDRLAWGPRAVLPGDWLRLGMKAGEASADGRAAAVVTAAADSLARGFIMNTQVKLLGTIAVVLIGVATTGAGGLALATGDDAKKPGLSVIKNPAPAGVLPQPAPLPVVEDPGPVDPPAPEEPDLVREAKELIDLYNPDKLVERMQIHVNEFERKRKSGSSDDPALRDLEKNIEHLVSRLRRVSGSPGQRTRAAATPELSEPELSRVSAVDQAESTRRAVELTLSPAATRDAPGPGDDPRSKAVRAALDQPVAMNFHNETPLEDVLKYLKAATSSEEFKSGVPIYVDPFGLQEAEATLTSPVTIDLEGVPLRRTLQLVLAQLRLVYTVEDGLVYITSKDSQGSLPPTDARPSRIIMLQQKAEQGELTQEEGQSLIELLKQRNEIERLNHENAMFAKTTNTEGRKPEDRKALLELLRDHEEIEGLLRSKPGDPVRQTPKGGFQ